MTDQAKGHDPADEQRGGEGNDPTGSSGGSSTVQFSEDPGYEGDAPNAPLASQGQRDSSHQDDDERGFDPDGEG